MLTYTHKTSPHKSKVASNAVSHHVSSSQSAFQFKDQRAEAIAQRKSQLMADNSSQVSQLGAFQEMGNNSLQAKNAAQLQAMMNNPASDRKLPIQKQERNTGLPANLKAGIESLSGYSMDDVSVHFNSNKPSQLKAHAYAQGTEIHLASGQEKHLPHEAWHVVQQKQGRVKPTIQLQSGVFVNDNAALEKEADLMGRQSQGIVQRLRQQSVPLAMTHPQHLINTFAEGSTFQLTEKGKSWGSFIGGALGGVAGAVAGYSYGTLSAATGAITGGISDAIAGYQHGGLRDALVEGASGTVTGALSGMSSGLYHGGMVGMTLGGALGGSIGDWLTGKETRTPPQIGVLRRNMIENLMALNEAAPRLHGNLLGDKRVEEKSEGMGKDEIKLLNWMYLALGETNFDKVAKGAQVRVPFNEAVFNGLISLKAQKRPSSHYGGILFASGFKQVVGEQYGTKGEFLPTVLFGKLQDREGRYFMYFQPEGNAYNPDTSMEEKKRHIKDAYRYLVHGVQQGPYGTSIHTDANPITDKPYKPTLADKTVNRYTDLKAFMANFVYSSGGSGLLSTVGLNSSKGQAIVYEILTKLGLYGATYLVWKRFGSGIPEAVWKKVMG